MIGLAQNGFEVREAFAENFARRRELGGACCVSHGGEKVVDLWGGLRNQAHRRAVGKRWSRTIPMACKHNLTSASRRRPAAVPDAGRWVLEVQGGEHDEQRAGGT